jgi:hypothetical protein
MNTWTRIIGVIVALYAGYVIYRGRVAVGDDNSTSYLERSEKPVQFWLTVVFMLAVAAVLILNVFRF